MIADAQADGLGKYFVGERVLVWISAAVRWRLVAACEFRRHHLDRPSVVPEHRDQGALLLQAHHFAKLDNRAVAGDRVRGHRRG